MKRCTVVLLSQFLSMYYSTAGLATLVFVTDMTFLRWLRLAVSVM